jgi:Uma2 family endonuclease
MATVAEKLLTADEYANLPDDGQPMELVRGRIVLLNMPIPRHGEICAQAIYLLKFYLEDHPLGRVVGNDSGVRTECDPDTVRGPDVAYYSYALVPRRPLPRRGNLSVSPELVFEVRSPGDRWMAVQAKVAEFLNAGVKVVCVLDDQTETALVYTADDPPRTLSGDQELTIPTCSRASVSRCGASLNSR